MSKAAAIHLAIRVQMAADGKSQLDLKDPIGGTPAVPGGAAAVAGPYSENNIRGFLANVASRLRSDTPPYDFNWSALNAQNFLHEGLWVLEGAIAGLTKEIPPPEPKGEKE